MTHTNPLGEASEYIDTYTPSLLYPISRLDNRLTIGLADTLPFMGFDEWTLYELSWLNVQGLPQVAMAKLKIDCRAPFTVESKSLKLYLNSWNQTKAQSRSELVEVITRDLSSLCQYEVQFELVPAEQLSTQAELYGECIDHLPVSPEHYLPEPNLLRVDTGKTVERECLYSHLLRSNCPVTNQPDWATVFIEYSGQPIERESLLAYIVSYRQHQGFHENCVERLFLDISKHCQPKQLSVYARYTRRGGVDINPLRTNTETSLAGRGLRITRQ